MKVYSAELEWHLLVFSWVGIYNVLNSLFFFLVCFVSSLYDTQILQLFSYCKRSFLSQNCPSSLFKCSLSVRIDLQTVQPLWCLASVLKLHVWGYTLTLYPARCCNSAFCRFIKRFALCRLRRKAHFRSSKQWKVTNELNETINQWLNFQSPTTKTEIQPMELICISCWLSGLFLFEIQTGWQATILLNMTRNYIAFNVCPQLIKIATAHLNTLTNRVLSCLQCLRCCSKRRDELTCCPYCMPPIPPGVRPCIPIGYLWGPGGP